MLAADLALQQKRHFGLSILLDRLTPKVRRIADIINILIVGALLAFLLFYAARNAILMHPRLIGATQMNASLIHASMVVGLALMLRTLVMQLYQLALSRETA
jgi:TRAP-type C4-dicarboxylate transport system permease small subunit